jgi:hypothetical protein
MAKKGRLWRITVGKYLPSCVSGEGGTDLQLFFMTFPTLPFPGIISL